MQTIPGQALAAAFLLVLPWVLVYFYVRRRRQEVIFFEINCQNCGAIFVAHDLHIERADHVPGEPITVPCCAFCIATLPEPQEEADALRTQGGSA